MQERGAAQQRIARVEHGKGRDVTDGLFTSMLNAIDPDRVMIARPVGVTLEEAQALVASAPSNQQVLNACKAMYARHTNAVDQTTMGSVGATQTSDLQPDLRALRAYNWDRKVAAPSLARPVLDHPVMNAARQAVTADGAFGTYFIGVQANLDLIFGGEGGAGVGFAFPSAPQARPIWMAYGGFRITDNIDIGVNLDVAIYALPPARVAGPFLGLELSGKPVAEGPEVSLGIYLTPDLEVLQGFTLGVGVGLRVVPVTVAIVAGKTVTSAS